MRNKKLLTVFIILLFAVLAVNTYAQTTKLKRIGSYTFVRIRGKVPTQEVMKTLADRYAADIKYGFELAGYGDLYLPFIDQLKTAAFKDTQIAVGDQIKWMLFRSHGKVKVAKNIEWAGRAPLEVFGFTVEKDYKLYDFIIPKPCGNIALVDVRDAAPPLAVCDLAITPLKANVNDPITIDMGNTKNAKSMTIEIYDAQGNRVATQALTPDSPKWQTKFDKPGEYAVKASALNMAGIGSTNPCEAKVYINVPPVCKLWTSCLPCEDYVGRPITFDASGSTDPDGEIVKAAFELTDVAGKVVDSYTATQKPFLWEKIFQAAGTYTISATVFDNDGAVSAASDACRLTFEVTQKRFFWLMEAGPLLAKGTYTTYGFLRGGMFYWITPKTLSFILSAGGAIPSKGDPWKFMFLANALLNVHAGPAFFGGGLGYSTKEQNVRKSGLDIVGNIGVDVFNKYTSMGSLFFEFRSPLGGDRTFDDHHKFALGFRMLF
ncbi:MAG: PKD domain-containing protein [Acidobacteriota bacterium]|nr:PKD domain-containing protein [Acidobacteriota bacterium]